MHTEAEGKLNMLIQNLDELDRLGKFDEVLESGITNADAHIAIGVSDNIGGKPMKVPEYLRYRKSLNL